MANPVSFAGGGVLGDSTETDPRNLIAERPFKVLNRNFASQDEAEAYASSEADNRQSDIYVIDRRTGDTVAVYEP